MKLFNYTGKIVRVVDGDTVRMDIDLGFNMTLSNESVRLLGINAPESRTRDLAEKEKGLAAKKFLGEILVPGTTVHIETKLDKRGKFGRTLGIIFLEGENINESMVNAGHAVYYDGGKR